MGWMLTAVMPQVPLNSCWLLILLAKKRFLVHSRLLNCFTNVFLPDSIAIASTDVVCCYIYLCAKVELKIGYHAIQIGHILVLICCFHMNTKNSDAPLIASGLQFLLQHQADNGELLGQGLAPCVPTSKKLQVLCFVFTRQHMKDIQMLHTST